jgi:hypothetical protein
LQGLRNDLTFVLIDEIATHWSVPSSLKKNESYGEGHGILTTMDGDSLFGSHTVLGKYCRQAASH